MSSKNTQQDIVIHVGFPKAGSTTLQCHVFFENDAVQYLARRPCGGNANALQTARSTSRFYQKLGGPLYYDREDLVNQWEAEFSPWLDSHKVNIMSDEGLTSNRVPWPLVVQRLSQHFPRAKVLVVLRSQFQILRALYDMHPYRTWKRERQWMPFSRWLEAVLTDCEESLAGALLFDEVIERYVSAFGRGQVGVFLFERLFFETDEMKRFAGFVGVCEHDAVRHLTKKPANPAAQHAFRNTMRRLFGPFHASDLVPLPVLRRGVRLGSRFYKGKKTVFSERQRAMVREFYSASNSNTACLLGEDLAAQGYPL